MVQFGCQGSPNFIRQKRKHPTLEVGIQTYLLISDLAIRHQQKSGSPWKEKFNLHETSSIN